MSKITAYSDRERAAALAVLDTCGGNIAEASRQTRIPWQTLKDWTASRTLPEGATEYREPQREALDIILERVTRQALGLMESKAQAATYAQLGMAACAGIEKMRLLRGDATSITELRTAPDRDHLARMLAEELGLDVPTVDVEPTDVREG